MTPIEELFASRPVGWTEQDEEKHTNEYFYTMYVEQQKVKYGSINNRDDRPTYAGEHSIGIW